MKTTKRRGVRECQSKSWGPGEALQRGVSSMVPCRCQRTSSLGSRGTGDLGYRV
ncbi:hypothetical protein PR202_gb16934 [Eleusine coracana subsp. coracana]|uniref:Uncharacterized protein n=1 Tax=Eleusine coracana subsp. coracana TaxID=191504 RepID=A0AAV5F128_ELECO|nr:hypothetical protein PR202_gb16934 [Eleusine coracana subsp. coracana]